VKALIGDFFRAFLLGFVLPSALMGITVFCCEQQTDPLEPEQLTILQEPPIRYPILHRTGAGVQERDLDTYLVGVVLAEMPASFEKEALKAQAVAARTYARRAKLTGGKHGDGSVCGEAHCCQAYISPQSYLEQGGTAENLKKVQEAVEATSGLVLTYEGELIEATYFSCSGGRTEDAAEVWGSEYPYLKSVESPGEEASAYYRDTVVFTPDEFGRKLGLLPPENLKEWITATQYTQAGSVRQMIIGGETFTGTQVRTLLGLRSAAFDLDIQSGKIYITTRGYGHRVGMSQYGADAMAVSGAGYGDILAHYYEGAALTWLGVETDQ
jgi:stage II sporulation protein D